MNVCNVVDELLNKYLKPNNELTPLERKYRNELIRTIVKWYTRVDVFLITRINQLDLELKKEL